MAPRDPLRPKHGDHTVLPDHDVRRNAITERVRNGLWFIPGVMVLVAALGATALVAFERSHDDLPLRFGGGASSAQDLMATIAASTLTMATLVLSITIVALQLASQQFSPRVMRTFLRDTGTKIALGTFLSTTVFALLVLRQVRPGSADRAAFVPGLAVSLGFVLALAALAAFVYYLNHVAHSIRAVHIMEAVAAESRAAIRDMAHDHTPLSPGEWPDRPPDVVLGSEQPPGALVGIDEDDLVELAEAHRVRLRIVPHVGDYLPSGIPVVEVWCEAGSSAPPLDEVLRHIGVGRERTMRQDVAFGLRQLVDIAEKALSPAVNDPTTAVQAIDRLHDLLRRIGRHPDPVGVYRDRSGVPRLDMPLHGWDEYVHLAFDEIRQYGGGALQVQARLRSAIDDLRTVVADDPDRVAALEAQRVMLDRAARECFVDEADRRRAGAPG
ncbi:MAG TPA: DUF2254 domain-containing protein [Aquihabitans sp.]|jgi:uncharacterized membrane protein|nr:DUF2254 domain-containing protein [Aquihabitans sp.]